VLILLFFEEGLCMSLFQFIDFYLCSLLADVSAISKLKEYMKDITFSLKDFKLYVQKYSSKVLRKYFI